MMKSNRQLWLNQRAKCGIYFHSATAVLQLLSQLVFRSFTHFIALEGSHLGLVVLPMQSHHSQCSAGKVIRKGQHLHFAAHTKSQWLHKWSDHSVQTWMLQQKPSNRLLAECSKALICTMLHLVKHN